MRVLVVGPKDLAWAFHAVKPKEGKPLKVDAVVSDPWYNGEPAVDEFGGADLPLGDDSEAVLS